MKKLQERWTASWTPAAACFVAVALLAVLPGCLFRGHRPQPGGPALPALVSGQELLQRVTKGPRPLIVDTRPRAVYDAEHIPGAFSAPVEDLMPFPVDDLDPASRERVAKVVRESRALAGYRIVAVDRGAAEGLQRAASFCWALSLAGFDDCHVLSGGLAAWKGAGGDVSREPPSGMDEAAAAPPAQLAQRPSSFAALDVLRRATAGGETALVDVSSGGAAGMPGAVRLPLASVLGADGVVAVDKLELLAVAAGIHIETEIIVLGEGALDGAAGWHLISRHLKAPTARLYPGGLKRWRAAPPPLSPEAAPGP